MLMTRPSRPRTRGRSTVRLAAGVLVLACLLLTVLNTIDPTGGFGPLDAARTVHARASGDSGREEACALIVGPAKAYCLRTTAAPPAVVPTVPAREANAWLLVPPAAGLLALAWLRRRTGRR
ncbi:hypothetical protein [Streptomyces sp. NPDC046925]|uniref:hypothetical protein n=1 Tax=Streptomyces sp. NPDC046925 TaxID=3155375 RepID=UPI0033DBC207